MDANWANYVGYAASFFVVLSFMVKNIKQIRVINLIGCIALRYTTLSFNKTRLKVLHNENFGKRFQ